MTDTDLRTVVELGEEELMRLLPGAVVLGEPDGHIRNGVDTDLKSNTRTLHPSLQGPDVQQLASLKTGWLHENDPVWRGPGTVKAVVNTFVHNIARIREMLGKDRDVRSRLMLESVTPEMLFPRGHRPEPGSFRLLVLYTAVSD